MRERILILGFTILAGCGSVNKMPDDGDDGADDASDDDDDGGPAPGYYRIYVEVTGLAGTLILQNGGGDDLIITEDGSHRFATDVLDGSEYAVAVMSDPELQNCHVGAGAGTIDSADVQLSVGCFGNILMWIDDNPDQNEYNHELWMSDGTAEGTGRSVSINDDETVGTGPSSLTRFGGAYYLVANDGTGPGLWRTDGSQANTEEVRAFANVGLGGSSLVHDGAIYFEANGDAAGIELWRYDGTVMERLTDINPAGNTSFGQGFAAIGNRLVFSANDGTTGDNPWSLDLGGGGAQLLDDVDPGAFAGQVGDMTALGDRAVFRAYEDALGFGVWVTDGTAAGTSFIHDMNPSTDGGLIIFLGSDGATAYFSGDDGTSGQELWKTDGTVAGTVQVKNINSGAADSTPGSMVAFGGQMWFVATDTGGTELWHTDGTDAGTQKLEVNPSDSIGSNPYNLEVVGDLIYFIADGGDGAGPELWATDGTPEGTARITDVVPGPDPGVGGLGPHDGRVLYFFDASYDATSLWRTDGTPEGTDKVRDICGEPPCYPFAQFAEIIP